MLFEHKLQTGRDQCTLWLSLFDIMGLNWQEVTFLRDILGIMSMRSGPWRSRVACLVICLVLWGARSKPFLNLFLILEHEKDYVEVSDIMQAFSQLYDC